jgi:RHS repeat-associated protein
VAGTFTVTNTVPVIGTVTDEPDPAAAGATVDFNVGWTDPGDTVRAVVCKTDAVSAAATCPGGEWARGSLQGGGSSVASHATVQADLGTRPYFAFACDSTNACSTTSRPGSFTVVNAVPGIISASDSPDPVNVGSTITFSVGWDDSGGDTARAVVCRTNAVSATATCPGGSWAIGSLSPSSPATAGYTPTQADVGTRNYWAFVCDSANACSGSLSGTFRVNNVAPSIGTVSDSPDPTTPGNSVTFSVGWTDAGDTAKAVVCRTNVTSGGACAGGTWAVGTLGSTSPATTSLTVTQAQLGTQTYHAFVCDSVGACSSSVTGSFTVNNAAPAIGTVSDSPDPVSVGNAVTFSAGWTDATDTVRVVVCKTNAVSTGSCPGGAWAIGELTASSPATVTYTPVQADIGTRNYWAFVCDSLNACSSSVTGAFTVQNRAPAIGAVDDAPDPVTAGDGIGFSAEWTDPGDTVKVLICRTNAVSTATCSGGAWAVGSPSPSSPATTAYTTSEADIGTRNYWAFVCDSLNACSGSVAGTFTVEPYTEAVPPAPTASTDGTGLEDFHPYQPFELGTGRALVNTATRNLTVQFTDLAVPGQGLNLGLTRTYNANRADVDGPLGKGWSLAVTDAPSSGWGRGPGVLATDSQLAFDDADGTRQNFVKDAAGLWHSPTGVNLMASNGTDGQGKWWAVTRPDGVRYEFRLVGLTHHLTRVADRKGNELTFAYTAGRIATVTDSTGRTITFTWTNGWISRARYQAAGDTDDIVYSVNATSATLTSVSEADGTSSARTTSFGYTGIPPMLTSATDAKGLATTFAYGPGAVLTALTDRAGKPWTITTGAACLADTPAGFTATCIVDPESKKDAWLTSAGNLVEYRDRGDRDEAGNARINTRTYVWVDNRLRRTVDEAGNLREFEWNGLGQLTSTRLSGGLEAPLETDVNYAISPLTPAVGDLVDIKVAPGTADERLWHFDYDAGGKGLVTATTDPIGSTTTLEYYGVRGLPKRVTDANAHATTFGDTTLADGGYDPSGQPKRVTDPTGATTQLEYDFLGRMFRRIDRTNKPWERGYDLRGNLTSEKDPLHHTTLHCYDANDNEILTVRPKASSPSCALDGTDGYSTKFTFDARDLLQSVLTASDGQRRKSTYAYYDDGELKEIFEPRSFNASTGLPSGTVQKASYERYENNRVSGFVDELGNRTDVVYTPDGLTRKVTDPPSDKGRHAVTYDYTKLRLVRSELETGHGSPTTYQYNLFGDQVAQTMPLGGTTVSQYDRAGRLTATVNALGRTSTRSYDAVGNLLTVTQPTGILASLITSYTYTDRNEIATETDPADPQHVVAYAYDGEGRQRFQRDHYGLQVPGGPADGPVERTTEQQYFDDGKLSHRISTFAGTTNGKNHAEFHYDDDGNTDTITTTADASTTVSHIIATHTSADELKTWTETINPPSGAGVTKVSSYAYAQDGLLLSRTIDGLTTTYEQTLNGHESKTTPWVSGAFSGSFNTGYYASGLASGTTMPNSATVSLGYDLGDRLQSKVVRHPNGAVLSAWEHVTYDDDDSRLSEVVTQRDTAGATRTGTAHNIYDKLDRLIASKHPLEVSLVPYVLDDAGNVLTETSWIYGYVANRLTSRSAFPGIPGVSTTSVYGYDDFGNQATETQGTNVATTNYDAASHTSSINDFGGFGISYEYDGLDRQVRRFDATNTFTLVFHDGPSDQVALEVETTGSGTATTTRFVLDSTGEVLADEQTTLPAPTDRSYYVTDPRTNLAAILDHNAVGTGPDVVATFGYDPFGAPKAGLTSSKPKPSGSGNWDSRLRFQLAPRDKHTGQYAIGPRMYDPNTYRFVGADWVAGSGAGMDLQLDPLTGNRYLYAGCNPVNLIDDGHKPKKPKDYQACGTIRVKKGGALFEITEVARNSYEGWVEYHINFTALGRYLRKSLWTVLHVQGKRVGWKNAAILQSVDSRVRDRTRPDSKPFYAHTTQRVKIGTELTFSGQIDYKEPWWGFDWSGVKLIGTCRA